MHAKYSSQLPAESLEGYHPGGYHPTHLGDKLKDGRYRIFRKLKFGVLSTIWLARDKRTKRNVIIKIYRAQPWPESEYNVYRHLQQQVDLQDKYPGHKHVLLPLDDFFHEGPNGRHLCIVTEVLGPSVETVLAWGRGPMAPELTKRIVRELLEAAAYLHAAGVAHGVPLLGALKPESLVNKFYKPKISKVTVVGEPQAELGPSVPRFAFPTLDFRKERIDSQIDAGICLIDFRDSFLASFPPPKVQTTPVFQSPELLLWRQPTSAVDIWSIACTAYALCTRHTLFRKMSPETHGHLFGQFQRTLGVIPLDMRTIAVKARMLKQLEKDVEDKDFKAFRSLEKSLVFYANQGTKPANTPKLWSRGELKLVGKLLRKMFVYKAENRAKAEDLLGDEWLVAEKCNDKKSM